MNLYLLPLRRRSRSFPAALGRHPTPPPQGTITTIFMLLTLWATAIPATACPFCSATAQTLSEEIQSADVAVLADWVTATGVDPDTELATFQILQVIRGTEGPDTARQLQVVYFGDPQPSKTFLITGISSAEIDPAAGGKETGSGEPRIDWSTPLPLSKEGTEYINRLGTLPAKGSGRLLFFMNYLEHDDPLLAQDAYDEFARAPYAQILELGDRMDRKQLVAWINDPQVGPTRRRLYLTMLGVCGQDEDVEMLESLLQYDYRQVKTGVAAMISFAGLAGSAIGLPIIDELVKAEARRKKQCLDALVACYLKLKGPAGLTLVDQQFLRNPAAEYTHVYATIMAIRFHGEETDVIPRQRLLQSLRLVLDNPEIADQVIPDLTRWEDWEILDRLVTMFKTSDSDGWIRQPVISYLVVAAEQPGDIGTRAEQALTELEQLDPKTVERARSLMAFSGFGRAVASAPPGTADQAAEKATGQDTPVGQGDQATDNQTIEKTAGQQPVEPPSELPDSAENQPATQTAKKATVTSTVQTDMAVPPTDENRPAGIPTAASQASQTDPESKTPKTEPAVKGATAEPPSRLTMIGVPLAAGLILMGIFAVLLRGSDFRATN